jgi:hypothetical protein
MMQVPENGDWLAQRACPPFPADCGFHLGSVWDLAPLAAGRGALPYQGSTISPRARLPRARQTSTEIVLDAQRTDPSAIATFTPPACQLLAGKTPQQGEISSIHLSPWLVQSGVESLGGCGWLYSVCPWPQ